MQTSPTLPRLLERTCENCSAKLDSDLPYCGACGFGLPKFPRPRLWVAASTTLFFLVGFPAGFLALYYLTFMLMGFWSAALPLVLLAGVFRVLLWFMLEMSEGTREYRYGSARR